MPPLSPLIRGPCTVMKKKNTIVLYHERNMWPITQCFGFHALLKVILRCRRRRQSSYKWNPMQLLRWNALYAKSSSQHTVFKLLKRTSWLLHTMSSPQHSTLFLDAEVVELPCLGARLAGLIHRLEVSLWGLSGPRYPCGLEIVPQAAVRDFVLITVQRAPTFHLQQ